LRKIIEIKREVKTESRRNIYRRNVIILGLLITKYYTRVNKYTLDNLGRSCKMFGGDRNERINASIKPEGKRPPEKPRSRWENNNHNILTTEQVNLSPMLKICTQKFLVSNIGYID